MTNQSLLSTGPIYGSVYFMQLKNSDGYVKIGFSTNVKERRDALQISLAYDLEIIGLVAGPASMERLIHGILSKHRIRGEWFFPSEEVLLTVKLANKYKGDDFNEQFFRKVAKLKI